ncbi:MAG: hypothetical protein ABI351_13030 [Herbaspirillum sp.]
MLPETQALIDEAEIRSGNPVHVIVDRDLAVSATIRMAGHAPASRRLWIFATNPPFKKVMTQIGEHATARVCLQVLPSKAWCRRGARPAVAN